MKQSDADLAVYLGYAALGGAVATIAGHYVQQYMAQNPNCDRGCQDRWVHLTEHAVPLVMHQFGFPG
jgi:hypothetical protein